MADNYLGNRMDDYAAGRLKQSRRPKLTPTGRRPGELALALPKDGRVWIAAGAMTEAGRQLMSTLRNSGLHVAFAAPQCAEAQQLAQQLGVQHFPPVVPAPEAEAIAEIGDTAISLDSGRVTVSFPPDRAQEAASLAAAFCTLPGLQAHADITL